MGKLGDAEHLYRQALCELLASLGEAHPEVLNCRAKLCRLLAKQGKQGEAEASKCASRWKAVLAPVGRE